MDSHLRLQRLVAKHFPCALSPWCNNTLDIHESRCPARFRARALGLAEGVDEAVWAEAEYQTKNREVVLSTLAPKGGKKVFKYKREGVKK